MSVPSSPPPEHLRLVRVPGTDPSLEPLMADLHREYTERYGPNDEVASSPRGDFEPPHGLFLVLVDVAGTVVAGGAFRRFSPGVVELKRLWTSPEHRRRGLARRVVVALEQAAREAGARELRLETGKKQPEAIALYTVLGYRPVEPWGRYAESGGSVYLHKELGA